MRRQCGRIRLPRTHEQSSCRCGASAAIVPARTHTPAADETPVRRLAVAFDCLALTSRAAADVELVRLLHLLAHSTPATNATPVQSHSIALHSRAADAKSVRLLQVPAPARCRIRFPCTHELLMRRQCGYCTCPHTTSRRCEASAAARMSQRWLVRCRITRLHRTHEPADATSVPRLAVACGVRAAAG